jgi:hypothetical protein
MSLRKKNERRWVWAKEMVLIEQGEEGEGENENIQN